MEQNESEIPLALYIHLQFSGTWLETCICASDTELESESQNDDDTEQST